MVAKMVKPKPIDLASNKDFSVVILPRLKSISEPKIINVPAINNNNPNFKSNLITPY